MLNQDFAFDSEDCLSTINNSILTNIIITVMLLKGNTISNATVQRVINTNLSEYEYINLVGVNNMPNYEKYRERDCDNYVLFSRPMNTKKKWHFETQSADIEDIQIEICDIYYDQTPDEIPLEFKVVEIPSAYSLKPYRFKEMFIRTTLAKVVEYLRNKGLI